MGLLVIGSALDMILDQSEEARERFLMPIDNERTPTPKQTVDQRTARASFAREAIAVW